MTISREEDGKAGRRRREHPAGRVHRILFPTDFSPQAMAAWPVAVNLARGRGAALYLLHVVTPPVFGLSPEAGIIGQPVIDDVLAEAGSVLGALAAPAHALGVDTRPVTRVGEAAAGILACADEEGIDLIVMATTGRTGLVHALMGSVAERVVRQAVCPVLTVRHDPRVTPAPLTEAALPRLRQILVPLDGSPLTEAALPGIIRVATRYRAAVRLLQVVHAHALRPVDLEAAQVRCVQDAETYLADIERSLAAVGLSTVTAVRYGETLAEIADDIQVNRPDLVALATHGRTGLFHLVLGSVAEHVLRISPVPVLLFPVRALPVDRPAETSSLAAP